MFITSYESKLILKYTLQQNFGGGKGGNPA